MGRIIQRKAADLIPCQTNVSLSQLAKLFHFFKERKHQELFPPVIHSISGGDIVLNGHHRLVLADLFDVQLNIYRAEDELDLITVESYPQLNQTYISETNNLIRGNYSCGERYAFNIRSGGYNSIRDLREKNGVTIERIERFIGYSPFEVLPLF